MEFTIIRQLKYSLLFLTFGILISPATLTADLFLDLSPEAGIQSSVSVQSGSTLLVTAVFVPEAGGSAVKYGDSVGVDLNWGFSGDSASGILVTPSNGAIAGPIAGVPTPGTVRDVVTAASVAENSLLATAGLGVGAVGASFNAGGSGMSDTSDISFGGISDRSNNPGSFELMSWQLQITGSTGDQLNFLPTGILDLDGFAVEVNGDFFIDGPTGASVPWSPTQVFGGVVQVVPEPTSGIAIAFALWGIHVRRRKRFAQI